MINRIVRWFIPEGQELESPEGFKLQAIIMIALLVGNSGYPFILLFFWMRHPREALVILGAWIIFMCIPFLARNKVRSNALAHILAGNYFQCHLFLCLLWGGLEAPNMMWFTATPVVSLLVGGLRHGIIWSSIAAFSILGIYAIEYFELIELNSSLTPGQQVFVTAMGAVGLLAAIFGSVASFEVLRIEAIRGRINAEKSATLAYQRTENLLLNILPRSIAERLITNHGTIADDFDHASVLFADLVGFTTLASTISASETVNLLNEIFSDFDFLVERRGLEKIKTIGDAYMVAGGVPTESTGHLEQVLLLAQEMLEVVEAHNEEHHHSLKLRIGVAVGPLTAGVIGSKKFSYDVWGDTVNLASRMESAGVPGRIQVTPAVAERMRDLFSFESRGPVEIKGKGQMRTFLLQLT